MSEASRRFGDRLTVVACTAGFCAAMGLAAGPAAAADYEVRLPVNKTVRMLPVSESENATAAPEAAPAEKSAAKPARKTAKPQPAKPAPAHAVTVETPSIEVGKPAPKAKKIATRHAAKSPDVESSPAHNATDAAPQQEKPAVKKHAVAKTQPREATGKPGETVSTGVLGALPSDGLWMGEVAVSIEEHAVVLRADTNKTADHVTWFNQSEPRKLAIDLRGQWRTKCRDSVLRFAAGPVKNLVIGQHEDRVRLAMEFREGVVAPDLTPKVDPETAGLVVTIPLADEPKP